MSLTYEQIERDLEMVASIGRYGQSSPLWATDPEAALVADLMRAERQREVVREHAKRIKVDPRLRAISIKNLKNDAWTPQRRERAANRAKKLGVMNGVRSTAAQDATRTANGELHAERVKTDPGYAARVRGIGKRNLERVNEIRRRCDECGVVSTPAGIGTHQKRKGHTGWEDVTS